MVKVNLYGKMVENILETIKMILNKDMENLNGLMDVAIKENGRKVKCMEKENIRINIKK
jgi:hypothetical protein